MGKTNALPCLGILLTAACSGGATTSSAPTATETAPLPAVVMPAGEIEATRVAVTSRGTCALLADRTVWCWGENYNGTSSADEWLKQMPVPPVATVEAALLRTYAVTADGELYFWGSEGEDKPSYVSATVPVRVDLPRVLDVAVGLHQACARLEDDVDCWDDKKRAHRRLGVRADAVAVTGKDVCVLAGGAVTCFGGAGGAERRTLDVKDATELAGTDRMVCARTARSTVECWGNDDAVAAMKEVIAGDPIARVRATPYAITGWTPAGKTRIATVLDFASDAPSWPKTMADHHALTDLARGAEHACFIEAGQVWCWGSNTFGQVFGPRHQDAPDPALISLGDLKVLSAAEKIAVGSTHTCVLGKDGDARCWGENWDGELGVGDQLPRLGPTRVPSLGRLVAVAAANGRTCFVEVGGRVSCAGSGASDTGAHVEVTTGAVDVAVGSRFACVLDATGGVRCWGENESGQLGAGDRVASPTPRPVITDAGKPLEHVRTLRAFDDHACAIDIDDALWCWGGNLPMQQGRPYASPIVVPVATRVTGSAASPLGKVADIGEHCLTSKRDGGTTEMMCWGLVFAEWGGPFAFEPVHVGMCGGVGPVADTYDLACFAAKPGLSCRRAWGKGTLTVATQTPVTTMSATRDWVCAIDTTGRVRCGRPESDLLHAGIGHSAPVVSDAPLPSTVACPVDPAPTTTPAWPPLPYATVVAEYVSGTSRPLTKAEMKLLVDAANDPKSFTDGTVLCGQESALFVRFKSAKGEDVAVIERSSCGTSFTPMLPRDVGTFFGPGRDFLKKLEGDLEKQTPTKTKPAR